MSNTPDYVMALAMNHDPAALIVGNTKIPVLVTDVSSEWSPVAAPNTEIRCQVVNMQPTAAVVAGANIKQAVRPTSHNAQCVSPFAIDRVYFNDPVTVVLWKDGTKTIVRCQEGDTYSAETGLSLCFAKKALGNRGNFNDVFKKFVPEEKVEETAVEEAAEPETEEVEAV